MKTPRGVRRNRRRVQTGVIKFDRAQGAGKIWAYYRQRDTRIDGWWPYRFYWVPPLESQLELRA